METHSGHKNTKSNNPIRRHLNSPLPPPPSKKGFYYLSSVRLSSSLSSLSFFIFVSLVFPLPVFYFSFPFPFYQFHLSFLILALLSFFSIISSILLPLSFLFLEIFLNSWLGHTAGIKGDLQPACPSWCLLGAVLLCPSRCTRSALLSPPPPSPCVNCLALCTVTLRIFPYSSRKF